jgi:VanZ family protein
MAFVAIPKAVSAWVPVVLWAGLIFGLSAIPSLNSGTQYDEVLRKAGHMTEFAIFAILLWRALRNDLAAFYGAVLYAASDEVHQAFVRGRHGSPIDVGIDAIGIAIGLLLLQRA